MEYVLHYDTSSSIGIIRMCARGAGNCDVLRIFQATLSYALTHARETRHSHDALIAGPSDFLLRHINQYNH